MIRILDPPKGGNPKSMPRKPVVGFRLFGASEPRTVKGQTARALMALKRAGARGITAQEMSSWALRLAHYIMELRRHGLDIETIHEAHPGGWHGRYVLHTPVEIAFAEGC